MAKQWRPSAPLRVGGQSDESLWRGRLRPVVCARTQCARGHAGLAGASPPRPGAIGQFAPSHVSAWPLRLWAHDDATSLDRPTIASACGMAIALTLAIASAACDRSDAAAGTHAPPPEVVVHTVEPEAITLTTELPGRTALYGIAEVRPQVSGIIQRRLFAEGTAVGCRRSALSDRSGAGPDGVDARDRRFAGPAKRSAVRLRASATDWSDHRQPTA